MKGKSIVSRGACDEPIAALYHTQEQRLDIFTRESVKL